jgi:tripartite-type tricarboxylate transporter receptor subunit TctC
MKRLLILLVLFSLLSVPAFAGAQSESEGQSYPSKEIHIIVPYNAGGGTDMHARLLQEGLSKVFSVPVVIDNIGGGASSVGSLEVLDADPDGYTVLMNIVNNWTQYALGNADFTPLDFELVAEAGRYALVEVTTGTNPRFNNYSDVVKSIKTKPGSVEIATNIGAITHFTSLGIQEAVGGGAEFDMVHIGDGAQRITDVLGGHVDLTLMGVQEALPYYKSNQMKVLGIFSDERVKVMPDVPTMKEQGLDYVQEIGYWYMMPPGTPKEIVDTFADAVEEVMQMDFVIERLEGMGLRPTFARGAEFKKIVEQDGQRLIDLAEKYNLAK